MNIFKAIKHWSANRKAISQLSNFSDRELNDIGLSRGSIREAVFNKH